ncbi:N-acetyltransferase [Undibacterium jejuense]|uniref:N-acetyltransferase n=1 Tax=Undibacterium jejuense TaxID=1344949 RepID=A0A923KMH8_9BURK|nr:acyltransferase [Undibacterium jejuense]MBC3864180.1 N-acetyltransferase [Undibacterium jejuense]
MTNCIHPSAIVSPKAKLGDNVTVGPFTVIHDNVQIGAGARIDGYCELGYPTALAEGMSLVIGTNATIRSHSVFYEGSSFGDGLVTGHHVTVREKTIAGKGFQIGTMADIQGHCEIGHYVKTQSSVTIGQKSKIGNFVWLFPGTLLTNDPNPPSNDLQGVELEDYVVVGVKSTLLPGVRIGKGSFVAAHSLVGQDMPEDSLISGVPAKRILKASDMRLKGDVRVKAYPWTKRFARGYPNYVIEQWANGIDIVEFNSCET